MPSEGTANMPSKRPSIFVRCCGGRSWGRSSDTRRNSNARRRSCRAPPGGRSRLRAPRQEPRVFSASPAHTATPRERAALRVRLAGSEQRGRQAPEAQPAFATVCGRKGREGDRGEGSPSSASPGGRRTEVRMVPPRASIRQCRAVRPALRDGARPPCILLRLPRKATAAEPGGRRRRRGARGQRDEPTIRRRRAPAARKWSPARASRQVRTSQASANAA